MLFNELSIYRHVDDELISTIKPGGYAYLYTGVMHERHEPGSDEEDEKMAEKERMAKDESKHKELYQGEVQLNKYVMKFIDDGNLIFESEPDYFYSIDADFVFNPEGAEDRDDEENNDRAIIKLETINFNTFIYSPYVLINQTDLPVYFGKKDAKLKNTLRILPHSNQFFNPGNVKKNKFSICVDEYDWADNFDISTLGMSGEGSMKIKKDADPDSEIMKKYKSNNINMGILITQLSVPFGKTTSIKFVPRYCFVNHCSRPVVLCQDWEKADKQYYIPAGGSVTYNFEHKDKQDNFVRLREARADDHHLNEKFEDPSGITITDWSSRFSIDDFEDFQISMKSTQAVSKEDEGKQKWHQPSKINDYRRFVRVIITTQDEATLFIMLCDPNMPEYRINNYSNKNLTVYQKDIGNRTLVHHVNKAVQVKGEANVNTTPIPYVWDDQTKDDKRVIVEIDGVKKEYDLDELEEKKELVVKRKKFFVKLISTGYFRELEIRDKKTVKNDPEKSKAVLNSLMVANNARKNGYKANLDLRGVGISFVDMEPKEVLYVSLFKIVLKAESEAKDKGNGVIETTEECDLILYHMQVDNMVSLENPILFSPDEVFDQKEILENEEYTPFVQIKISYSHNQSANVSRRKVDAVQVMIQKMKAEVETGSLNDIINTVTEITGVFGDQGTEYLSAQTVKQKEAKQIEQERESKKSQVSKGNNEERKSAKNNVNDDQEFRKEDVCEELDSSSPASPDLKSLNTDKLYFGMISLGAIKISVTFRFEKKELNFDINQGFGALTIVYTVATSIANVSDAPLSFKELVITNVFQSQTTLVNNLVKNYVRQGIFQFYKLIGSSDLLGNPVGFVDKLGSGVFEFFNEPRKGLIKGPKEFAGGIGKGVTSLVTGVVSASFDSVSKITGSLYSVAKNVTGQEALPSKKSENVAEGVYDGVLGGGKEIVGGVTGVFTKPFQGAQQEGAKGFFKGVGKGVLGLVASPVTAVLRAGHSVSQGVTNTAIRIKRGKLPQYGRFRHPRYINTRNVLEPYDEDFAEVNQILIKIDDGKYSKHSIKYFCDFPLYKDTKKTKDEGTLIITEQTLLFCKNEKKTLYNTSLVDISDIAVYEGGKDSETELKLYHLYVYSKKNKNYVFETVQYALIDKTYSIMSKEKASHKKIPPKNNAKRVK